MAKSKKRRSFRGFGRRLKRRATKAKPSIAVLGGLAVGPVQALTGSSSNYGVKGAIWSVSGDKMGELWRRLQIEYTGTYMGGGGPVNLGKATGTIAAAAGFGIHWLANILGANRVLARMKLPFRI